MTIATPSPPTPRFPAHSAPRVWFLTSGDSPIAIALTKQVLAHGDFVVAGIPPGEAERDEERSAEFSELLQDVGQKSGAGGEWRDRMRVLMLDVRCASLEMEWSRDEGGVLRDDGVGVGKERLIGGVGRWDSARLRWRRRSRCLEGWISCFAARA